MAWRSRRQGLPGACVMDIYTCDAETFFDDSYSLKKCTTEEYIRSDLFECHGWAVKKNNDSPIWVSDGEMHTFAWQERLNDAVVIAHHAHFDLLILNYHYNIRPKLIMCTLSMGRVCFDGTVSLGLDSLATRFGLKPKSVPYNLFKGKHWDDPDFPREQVADGAMHDCALTWEIANYLLNGHPLVPYPFPASEIPVVDLTIRMFTEPTLIGDLDALGRAWSAEEQARRDLFALLGVDPSDLRKDDVFADMLRALGVEPEEKVTAKGNEKYAFAKSDWFMQDLVTGENEEVALLAEARLKAHSSIYQTRAERLGFMATRGPMPVYLSYAAAHTRRWGGGDKVNWQNFPRSDPSRPEKGALRRAIKAPKD